MSEEQGARKLSTPSKKLSSRTPNPTERTSPQTSPSEESSQLATPPKHGDIPADETSPMDLGDRKPPAKRDHPSASQSTSPSTPEGSEQRARQVIAVSASKGPAAFFNLARKFLVTDEMCDLSALEGAIVSAVDAAHLLERSKLASIVRVQTSYVTVEPKRRKQVPSPLLQPATPPHAPPPLGGGFQGQPGEASIPSGRGTPTGRGRQGGPSVRELRRARIVITVKRTESYKKWLEENPLQAIIAGDGDDDDEADTGTSPANQETSL